MEMKKYIKKALASEDENKRTEMLDLICKVMKEYDSEELERAVYEIAEGKVLNEEKAKALIEKMKPTGMKWTLEETEGVRTQFGFEDIRPVDFWIVMNSAYNDFNDIFKDNVELYAKYSKAFICDEDAKEDKVYYYFSMIPR